MPMPMFMPMLMAGDMGGRCGGGVPIPIPIASVGGGPMGKDEGGWPGDGPALAAAAIL